MLEFAKRYGPIALVTGASSGIGFAFAEELAERGFDLVLTARREDRLLDLARRVTGEFGTQVTIFPADLVDPAAPGKLIAQTAGMDIGLVVSNAGFNMKGVFEKGSPSRMAKLLTVNCHAPMQLAHGFVPRLKNRGKGGFIATASIEGLIGMPYSAAYASTKALIVSLCEGLWAELALRGVDVLALCPGLTESEATAELPTGKRRAQEPMLARELVRQTLDNIGNGPVFVARPHMEGQFEKLLAMPRREALTAMEQTMREFV